MFGCFSADKAQHGLFLLLGQPTEGVKFSFFDLIFRDIKVIFTSRYKSGSDVIYRSKARYWLIKLLYKSWSI